MIQTLFDLLAPREQIPALDLGQVLPLMSHSLLMSLVSFGFVGTGPKS